MMESKLLSNSSFGKPDKLDHTVIRFLEKFENESM